jgi:hypothetical protein
MTSASLFLYTRPDFAKLNARILDGWHRYYPIKPIIAHSSFASPHLHQPGARRTVEGGRNLQPAHWAVRPSYPQEPSEEGRLLASGYHGHAPGKRELFPVAHGPHSAMLLPVASSAALGSTSLAAVQVAWHEGYLLAPIHP